MNATTPTFSHRSTGERFQLQFWCPNFVVLVGPDGAERTVETDHFSSWFLQEHTEGATCD